MVAITCNNVYNSIQGGGTMRTLINQEEMRDILGLSRATCISLRKEGMPHIQVSERSYRFNPDEVIEWFKVRTKKIQQQAQ